MNCNWELSYRADPFALPIADRHYNRQHVGSPQFVPPGRCIVLLTAAHDALWVSSFPEAQYVKHRWAGAWICTCFRNESLILSSELIRDAVAVTRWYWGTAPSLGMITFVDSTKVKSKRDWGRCFRKAGFKLCGLTQGGLIALQLLPVDMPEPFQPINAQLTLFT